MDNKEWERLKELSETIDDFALADLESDSRPELIERIRMMMWTVTWALEDLSDMAEVAQ